MLAAVFGALAASIATGFLIGHAFVARPGTFWRSKRGVWLLIALGLSVIPLPPQVAAIDSATLPLADVLGEAGASAFAWPAGLGKTTYLVLWAVLTLVALLAGMRIWKIGTADWRGGSNVLWDSSSTSRVSSLLPMANSLEDALDTLRSARLTARDAPQVAGDIRRIGRLFASELPEKAGDVYREVADRMPGDVASIVTGYLLEGAGRRGVR